MKTEKDNNQKQSNQKSRAKGDNLPGYPIYPESEDIYNVYLEEKDVNPEDIFQKKEPIRKDKTGRNTEKNWDEESPGNDLDIPGSELDDDMEDIGSEDEENNYYSLGGDDHEDLEEDREE